MSHLSDVYTAATNTGGSASYRRLAGIHEALLKTIGHFRHKVHKLLLNFACTSGFGLAVLQWPRGVVHPGGPHSRSRSTNEFGTVADSRSYMRCYWFIVIRRSSSGLLGNLLAYPGPLQKPGAGNKCSLKAGRRQRSVAKLGGGSVQWQQLWRAVVDFLITFLTPLMLFSVQSCFC